MNEILEGISEKEYRALPIESYSSLKYLLKSTGSFKDQKENPFKGNDSTLKGTCIHHYLQGNRHLVAFSRISKLKKKEYAEFEQQFKDLAGDEGIIVPASFDNILQGIMKSANDNIQVQDLLKDLKIEVPLVSTYKGMKFKGKLDGIKESKVIEIKSSYNATNNKEFHQEVLDRDYDLQAAMYLYASGMKEHYFIVVNTGEPYKVKAYKTSKKTIESGYKKLDIIVDTYNDYIQNGVKEISIDEYEEV